MSKADRRDAYLEQVAREPWNITPPHRLGARPSSAWVNWLFDQHLAALKRVQNRALEQAAEMVCRNCPDCDGVGSVDRTLGGPYEPVRCMSCGSHVDRIRALITELDDEQEATDGE